LSAVGRDANVRPVCSAASHTNDEARIQFCVIEAVAGSEHRVRVHHARGAQIVMRVTTVVGDCTDEMSRAGWRTDQVLYRGFFDSHCGYGDVGHAAAIPRREVICAVHGGASAVKHTIGIERIDLERLDHPA